MDPNSDRIDEHLDDWAEWERKLHTDPGDIPPFETARDALEAAQEVINGLWRAARYWEHHCLLAEQERDQYIDATNRVLGLGQYSHKWGDTK